MKNKQMIENYGVMLNQKEQEEFDYYRKAMNTAQTKEEVVHFYHLAMFVLQKAKRK